MLLRKPPVKAECYNDLDGQVVNLFRVLRDPLQALELQRRCRLTPFARAEFDWSYEPAVDAIDWAHKTIVLSFFGYGSDSVSRSCRTGFRARLSGSNNLPSLSWATWWQTIEAYTARLAGVLIEQDDALTVMRRHDGPTTLHYVDPPYLASTRSAIANGRGKTHGYRHELTDDDHRALAAGLRDLAGMVVLSAYPSALYDEIYAGWRRFEREALADGARKRTEVLWLNPRCAAHLARPSLLEALA